MKATRRWLPAPRMLVDLLVAAVVAVLSVADVAATSAERLPTDRAADGFAYVLVIVGALSLVWRRRASISVLAMVTGCLMVFWLRDYSSYLSVLGLPALYAVGAHAPNRRRAWSAVVLACVALMVTASVSVLDRPEGFAYFTAVSMAAFLAGSVVAGVVIRNRERIFVDSERRAAEAEADRLAEAERAVVRERRRIAREMHDVVAHGMSVVAVQAAAGQEIVHTNPDKAAEVFARIEAVGRESLIELRRMLGVLRDVGDEDRSLAPQPTMAEVASAVAECCAAGMPASLSIEGSQRDLAPGVELTVFRIVQEALTNVRKHAGGSASATVQIVYSSDVLVVEVADDGVGAVSSLSDAGGGHGLIGMRERVEIYGGEFTSGPRRGGGYAVRAVLPVAAAASVAGTAGWVRP